MLVTFKSSAAPDVQMLENHAQYLLGIVGKRLGDRGVITHAELPDAIARLDHQIEMPVGLAQRAFPFLVMLRNSLKAQADIIWGV